MPSNPHSGPEPPATKSKDPDGAPEHISTEQQRELYAQFRLDRARIPKQFEKKTLETFETGGKRDRKKILSAARSFVDSFGDAIDAGSPRGLILYGPTGSGKTHILVSILRELVGKGHKALFYNVPNLFKEIRATFDGNEERDEDDLLDDVANAEVLALDDLGAEKTSDWVLDRLYLIINQRYEACRPTLLTTNHDWPDGLKMAVGERIASRMAEMCKAIGPFPDEDWRLRSAGLKRRMS